MFKKIEIWILYLVIVVFIVFTIFFGVLVRQELVGTKKLGLISKYALIISEIPVNLKNIYNQIIDDGYAMLADSRQSAKPNFKRFKNNDRTELLILSRFDGDLNIASVEIINLNDFSVIHKYNPDIESINKKALKNNKKEFFNIKADASPNRFLLIHPLIDKAGNLVSHNEEGPIFKMDICNNVKWVNSKERFHHSNEVDHENNYWAPTYMEPYSNTMQKYRNNRAGLLDDAITKISKSGKILYQKSVFEVLMEGRVVRYNDLYVNGDPIHLNDIQPVIKDSKHWKKGDLFLSLRNLNTIILYRPSINKVLKIINGPFVMQHDVDIISDNEISIFNNNVIYTKEGPVAGNIDILIYNFDTNKFYKKFAQTIVDNDIITGAGGLSDFLDDGSLFIEEQGSGRLLLIDNKGELEWEYVNKNKNNIIYQTSWSRIIKDKSMIKDIKEAVENKNCK